MALSARELVLILRATNQASGPIRQVARDLRSLGTGGTAAGRSMNQLVHPQFYRRMGLAGAVIRDTGRSARIMGIATVAGLGYASSAAARFSQDVGYIATQTGRTSATVADLQKNAAALRPIILNTMRDSTSSTEELTQAAYDLFSSVDSQGKAFLTLSDGAKLLKLNSDAAVAGQTDIATATDASISVMNAFGQTVTQMRPNIEKMFSAVRFGRMTFAQLAKTLSTTAPAAKAAGQSFDTLLGTMAFLTRRLDVNKAAIGFARLTEILAREKMVSGLKKVGVEVTDASGQMKQLPDIIQGITDRFPELERGGVRLVQFFKKMSGTEGTIQARRAFVFLAQQMDQYREMLNRTTRNTGEFSRALGVMEQTTGVKWAKFTNQLRAFALVIGTLAMPVLLKLVQPLIDLFRWFEKLDKATQNQIVRWTAIAAAIAIVGGTLASIIGTIMTIIAPFKMFGGSMTVLLGTLGLVAAAILVLTGNTDILGKAFDRAFNLATSSAKNAAIAIGLIGLAMYRLQGAVLGSALLARAARGAGLIDTMLFGRGGPRANAIAMSAQTRAIQQQARAARGLQATLLPSGRQVIMTSGPQAAQATKAAKAAQVASKAGRVASGAWRATAASIAFLPGPLKIAAALTGAVAGAAFLWSRHMDNVARKAQEARDRLLQIQAPGVAAERMGDLPDTIISLREARNARARLNREITTTRKELEKAKGAQRGELNLRLNELLTQRARAMQNLNVAYQNVRVSAGAFTDFLARQQNALTMVGRSRQNLSEMVRQLGNLRTAQAGAPPTRFMLNLEKRIAAARRELERWKSELRSSDALARTAFNKVVTTFQQLGELPKGIGQTTRRMAFDFQRSIGRLMTPAQMKNFFKLALDPKALADANGKMAAFINRWRREQLIIQAQVKIGKGKVPKPNEILALGRGPLRRGAIEIPVRPKIARMPGGAADIFSGLKAIDVSIKPKAQTAAAKKTLNAAFKTPIIQPIKVQPPGNLSEIGRNISLGIQAGMLDVRQQVVVTRITNNYVRSFEKAGDGGSPMMLFARKVGIPMIQGVIVGILSMSGEAADAAVSVIDQIEGKTVAKMTSFLQKEAKTLRQRNQMLQQLVRRGVPLQLVEQLTQMGDEGQKQIAALANASQRDLRKFVVAWKNANAQVSASARFNWTRLTEFVDSGAQKLLDIYNEARDQLRDFVLGSLNDFTELSRRGADALGNAFGQLFQGPMNISDKIGSAFDDAMASYSSSMADLETQMLELQERQADTISEFMERRRDELRQQFGQLFSGPILGQGFMAGSVRDLIADLNAQLSAFQNWRRNLDALASRGLPAQLLRQLEELGIEGAHNIALLTNATDVDLAEWVKAWQAGQGAIETVTQATFMNMEGFAEAMSEIAEQMAEVAQRMAELKPPERATFATLLADLQAQKTAWTDYNTILTDLRNRGVPGALLTQLAELGVEGIEILRILNSGTDEQLGQYVALWISAQTQIKTAKDSWMKAMDPAEILTGLSDQVAALETWDQTLAALAARGVPKQIIQQLREMGPDALPLLLGLNSMTNEQLFGENGFVKLWGRAHQEIDASAKAWVDSQVALWRGQGSKIALGIIAGVMDEQEKLLGFFRNLFKNLLQEAKNETKTRSPSMVYYELGRNIVRGFQAGLSSITPSLATPTAPAIGGAGYLGRATQAPVQMTVNAHHSESLQSTLERTSFRMRQRRIN